MEEYVIQVKELGLQSRVRTDDIETEAPQKWNLSFG